MPRTLSPEGKAYAEMTEPARRAGEFLLYALKEDIEVDVAIIALYAYGKPFSEYDTNRKLWRLAGGFLMHRLGCIDECVRAEDYAEMAHILGCEELLARVDNNDENPLGLTEPLPAVVPREYRMPSMKR